MAHNPVSLHASVGHAHHLAMGISMGNGCDECRADNSRSFCPREPWRYQHVSNYLKWARAGFANKGVRTSWAGDRLTAAQFSREFQKALHARINLKRPSLPVGRKYASGYLERCGHWYSRQLGKWEADAGYLRQFAERRGYGN